MWWWLGLLPFAWTAVTDDRTWQIATVVFLHGVAYHGAHAKKPRAIVTRVLRVYDIASNVILVSIVNLGSRRQPDTLVLTSIALCSYCLNLELGLWYVHVLCVQLCLWIALRTS